MNDREIADYRARVMAVITAVQNNPKGGETAITAIMALVEEAWEDGYAHGDTGNDGGAAS